VRRRPADPGKQPLRRPEQSPKQGKTMDLAELTDELRKQAGRNVKLGYKVKFMLDEGVIFWNGIEAAPEIGNEDQGEADTTINISAENLEKLMKGALDPTLAYMTGKLKVEGKMGVALKLTSMFAD
jgi:putative sterol carrier protein